MTRRVYHPSTQKAINTYARKYLALYRASRSGGCAPETARWQAGFFADRDLKGKTRDAVCARIDRASRIREYWRQS